MGSQRRTKTIQTRVECGSSGCLWNVDLGGLGDTYYVLLSKGLTYVAFCEAKVFKMTSTDTESKSNSNAKPAKRKIQEMRVRFPLQWKWRTPLDLEAHRQPRNRVQPKLEKSPSQSTGSPL